MRILVTFAVDAEFAPWRKLRPFKKSARIDVDYFGVKIDGAEVIVLLTGVGCKKSWVEASKAIWDGDVDVCISSGLAGGLKEEHRLGEILVAERVLASKRDEVVECDSSMVETAISCGAKRVRAFYTADHVILDSSEKHKLGAFADAVEMESGEILLEAAGFGAKVVAIRAISDVVNEDLPIDFNKVSSDDGDVSLKRIVGELAQAPNTLPALIRFGRRSRAAAQRLATFLEQYIPGLLRDSAATVSAKVASR
jgi:adenosylhomocysteine nucleosidase